MEITQQAINLGGGHCCACSVSCNHIGPIYLCAMHERIVSRRREVHIHIHHEDAPMAALEGDENE